MFPIWRPLSRDRRQETGGRKEEVDGGGHVRVSVVQCFGVGVDALPTSHCLLACSML